MAKDNKDFAKANAILEQYKLYVNSAEKISDRRALVNRYFVSIQSLVLVSLGVFSQNFESNLLIITLGAVCGLVLSVIFFLMINSYSSINTVKFELIHDIEKKLPLRLYKMEWDNLKRGNGLKYIAFSEIEKWVVAVFFFIHIIVLSVSSWHLVF